MTEHVQVAGGLVYAKRNDGYYALLLDDRFGKVTLPKGHLEPGEILEQAAVREVYEETGVVSRVVSPIAKVTYAFVDAHRGEEGVKDAYYFLMEMTDGSIRPQLEEVDGARFVPVNEVEAEVRAHGYDNNVTVFMKGLAMLNDLVNGEIDLAAKIDHTLLRSDATGREVERLCREAAAYQFASVCVNPVHVERAAEFLTGTSVKVCAVVGFPLGANTTAIKVAEAGRAIRDGAEEIDMVAAIGKLREGDVTYVENDIRAVVDVAGAQAIVKVILETGLLDEKERMVGAECALRAGAHYVKTSTGFVGSGATVDAVKTLRQAVGDRLGVKAAGGIRTRANAFAMLAAGASRIGASAGVKLAASARFSGWDN